MTKLLIVDDDPLVVKMYRKKFASEKFETFVAFDGEEGLALAESAHPDVILLDIKMPRMDGIAMMEKLRKETWGHKIPVVIISNLDADDERIKKITRTEPAYYLLKPNYTLEDLVMKVREVLGNQRRP